MAPVNVNPWAGFLQAVGYHAVTTQPLLPMYLHLIVSALFPIYTGSHASLSRPSSAAIPPKNSKKSTKDDHDDDDEAEQKMEGLSPMDALVFPAMGGLTLAGLYYLIKYLEDPALLNKIMNWYFAVFGMLSLARLLTDTMVTIMSFIFPRTYEMNGEWRIDAELRKAEAVGKTSLKRDSPLPGYLALLPLPMVLVKSLWAARAIPSYKLRIHAYVHNHLKANFKLGPLGITGVTMALLVELYFNLIGKPWWMTNLLGFSFSYAALQIMSPTTASTGTLILGGLFLYDIFFVFFTPMMVTVATKIDIPAKLLFPRPSTGGAETKEMSMLGLGDVVLPGMMIGFALRFDLYLFYLRKQTQSRSEALPQRKTRRSAKIVDSADATDVETVKAKWRPAAGGWGERFWAPNARDSQGGKFSKTYFHATIAGYVLGLLFTLGIMQIFGHAQPALLYLVPGVQGALWGTAFVRGDVKTLWNFNEAEEEEEDLVKRTKLEGKAATKSGWTDWSFIGRMSEKLDEQEKKMAESAANDGGIEGDNKSNAGDGKGGAEDEASRDGPRKKLAKWDGKLLSFSISLPDPSQQLF